MKPLQVYLAEDEMKRLDDWSRARGWTKSQAIRAAVRALTAEPDEDPVLLLSGMVIDSIPADCSERFDRYLQETYVAEDKATYGKRSSKKRRLRR